MKRILLLLTIALVQQSLTWPVKSDEPAQVSQPDKTNKDNQQQGLLDQIRGVSSNTRWGTEGMGLPPQGALELMHAQQRLREQETQPSFGEEIKSGLEKLDPGLPTEKPFGQETKEWLEKQGEKVKSGVQTLRDKTSGAVDSISQQAKDVKGVAEDQAQKLRHSRQVSTEQVKEFISEAGDKVKDGLEKAAAHGEVLKEVVQENLGEEGRKWIDEQEQKLKEGFSALRDAALQRADAMSKTAANAQVAEASNEAVVKLGEATVHVSHDAADKAEGMVDQAVNMMKAASEKIRQARDAPLQEGVDETSEVVKQSVGELGDWVRDQTMKLRDGYFVLRRALLEKSGELRSEVADVASNVKETASDTVRNVAENVKAGAAKPVEATKSTMEKMAEGIKQRRRRQAQATPQDQSQDQKSEEKPLFSPEDVRSKAKSTSQWGNTGAVLPPQGGLELMFMQQRARENEEQPSFGQEIKTGLKSLDPGFNTERPIGQSIKESWDTVAQSAKDATSGLRQKAEQTGQQAKDAAGNVKAQAEQTAESVRQRTRRQLIDIDDTVVVEGVVGDEAILVEEASVIDSPISDIAPFEVVADTVEVDIPVEPSDFIISLKKRQADVNSDLRQTATGGSSEDSKSAADSSVDRNEDPVAKQRTSESAPSSGDEVTKQKRQTVIIEDDDEDEYDGSFRSSRITVDTYNDPYSDDGYQHPYPYLKRKRQAMIDLERNAKKEEGSKQHEDEEKDGVSEESDEQDAKGGNRDESSSEADREKRSAENAESISHSRSSEEGFKRQKRLGFSLGLGGLGLGPYGPGFGYGGGLGVGLGGGPYYGGGGPFYGGGMYGGGYGGIGGHYGYGPGVVVEEEYWDPRFRR